jgi:SNF family Na+-dependent transporter
MEAIFDYLCSAQVCPLLKGAGVGTVVMSFLLATYYNVIMAWALFYLFSSFSATLPWESCDNDWNSPDCRPIIQTNSSGRILPADPTTINMEM